MAAAEPRYQNLFERCFAECELTGPPVDVDPLPARFIRDVLELGLVDAKLQMAEHIKQGGRINQVAEPRGGEWKLRGFDFHFDLILRFTIGDGEVATVSEEIYVEMVVVDGGREETVRIVKMKPSGETGATWSVQ